MKFCCARGMALMFGICCAAGVAAAEPGQYGAPSLLPLPLVNQYGAAAPSAHYPNTPVGYYDRYDSPKSGNLPAPMNPPSGSPSDMAPAQEYASPYAASGAPCHGTGGGCSADLLGGNYAGDDVIGECGGNSCCWFGGLKALIMTRDRENFKQLSFDDTDPVGQVISTHDAYMDWEGGFEARFGRYLCGGELAIEVVYWGIFPSGNKIQVNNADIPGALNTVFDFTTLIDDNNVVINSYFDNAQAHCLSRDSEFHNVEINLMQGQLRSGNCGGCGAQNLTLSWMGGFRYFKFAETFQYHTSDGSATFGVDPDSEYYYDIELSNQLYGFQVGCRADYLMNDCFRLHASPKVGVYGNALEHYQRIYNDYGVAEVGPGNPLAGEEYSIESHATDVAIMAELDLGLDWRISQCWSATAGYRAVAVTGVALASNQIPTSFADIPGVRDIDTNGSLILHGLYVGGEYNW